MSGEIEIGLDGLALQDKKNLNNLDELTPLSSRIISRQATINIGTIGHVAHGKSTCVHALSGVKTVRFKDELERNITIKLGYANAKIFECSQSREKCPSPARFTSYCSSQPDNPPCKVCGSLMILRRHVSFVDCPGHDILMATMLNGTAVMDAAMLLVSGNESCPQPQTSEHLAALEIMRLKHILVLQNKIDLTTQAAAARQYEEIKRFTKGTIASEAPIIPISAQLRYNIDYLCEYLVTHIPVPSRNLKESPRMTVIRSFDVNKPGTKPKDLKGGVAGGTLSRGVLKIGDKIEIRPGYITKDSKGRVQCTPIESKIISLHTEQNKLEYAIPGGLIGVGTMIDPTVARSDRLVGNTLGLRGMLPDIYGALIINFQLLTRLLGVKRDKDSNRQVVVRSLSRDESLLLNIGSLSTGGRVNSIDGDIAHIDLNSPVCTEKDCRVSLSRRIDKHWRLIGWGTIIGGKKIIPKSG